MATHDYVISNASGAAVRADLNNALAAIVTNNSSATAPTTTYAYQWWADTGSSPAVMKLRNAANSAWITLFQLDGEWTTLALENGTAAAPSIYFKDSGTDTGIYSPGVDQVGIATGGTNRLLIDSAGQIEAVSLGTAAAPVWSFTTDADTGIYSPGANQLAISTNGTARVTVNSSGSVGIGTTSPSAIFHTKITTDRNLLFNTNLSGDARITALNDANSANVNFVLQGDNVILQTGGGAARIDSSGRLLVGTSTATNNIRVDEKIAVVNTVNAAYGGIALTSYPGAYGDPAPVLDFQKSRGTSDGSFAEVISGDVLGHIVFRGADGAGWSDAASIRGEADGDWTTSGDTTDSPGRLVFSTTADGASSPTERMRIKQNGFIKISSTGGYYSEPGSYHEIRSATNNNFALIVTHAGTSGSQYGINIITDNDQNDATRTFLRCDGGATTRLNLLSNGGLANYQANNVNLSDINTKKDISPAADTWDCIKEWEIVNYRYKDQPDDADLNLGVIAQQVAESCPEVITVFQEAKEATETEPAQEERLGVKEQQMYWMAIKALQEAQVRIEQLEAKVAALEAA